MKWFDNIKIRNKLIFVFGMLVLIMISFAVLSIVEITNIGNDNNNLINTYQARQILIADATVDLHKMRFANLSRGYLVEADNAEAMVSGILEDYDESAA
jgi:CHASE3 domain sensor protein